MAFNNIPAIYNVRDSFLKMVMKNDTLVQELKERVEYMLGLGWMTAEQAQSLIDASQAAQNIVWQASQAAQDGNITQLAQSVESLNLAITTLLGEMDDIKAHELWTDDQITTLANQEQQMRDDINTLNDAVVQADDQITTLANQEQQMRDDINTLNDAVVQLQEEIDDLPSGGGGGSGFLWGKVVDGNVEGNTVARLLLDNVGYDILYTQVHTNNEQVNLYLDIQEWTGNAYYDTIILYIYQDANPDNYITINLPETPPNIIGQPNTAHINIGWRVYEDDPTYNQYGTYYSILSHNDVQTSLIQTHLALDIAKNRNTAIGKAVADGSNIVIKPIDDTASWQPDAIDMQSKIETLIRVASVPNPMPTGDAGLYINQYVTYGLIWIGANGTYRVCKAADIVPGVYSIHSYLAGVDDAAYGTGYRYIRPITYATGGGGDGTDYQPQIDALAQAVADCTAAIQTETQVISGALADIASLQTDLATAISNIAGKMEMAVTTMSSGGVITCISDNGYTQSLFDNLAIGHALMVTTYAPSLTTSQAGSAITMVIGGASRTLYLGVQSTSSGAISSLRQAARGDIKSGVPYMLYRLSSSNYYILQFCNGYVSRIMSSTGAATRFTVNTHFNFSSTSISLYGCPQTAPATAPQSSTLGVLLTAIVNSTGGVNLTLSSINGFFDLWLEMYNMDTMDVEHVVITGSTTTYTIPYNIKKCVIHPMSKNGQNTSGFQPLAAALSVIRLVNHSISDTSSNIWGATTEGVPMSGSFL